MFQAEDIATFKAINRKLGKSKRVALMIFEQFQALIGDTYNRFGRSESLRKLLKEYGGQWNGDCAMWVFPVTDLPALIVRLVDERHQIANAEDAYRAIVGEIETSEDTQPSQSVPSNSLPNWFVPPSWWMLIQTYVKHRPAIAVVGPAGNGKTTACEVALTWAGMEFYAVSCTSRTEVLDLVGGTVLTVNGEEWRDGVVTRAFREGKGVILDEADALDPRVLLSLQNALQDAGADGRARFINTPHERVYPVATCPIILCMNTFGSGNSRTYNGRNKLDSASLDRLSFIATRYENEVSILTGRGFSERVAERVVKWARQVREQIDEGGLTIVLSPRTLLRICQCVETFGWALEMAIELEFMSRLESSTQDVLRSVKV